MARTQINIVQDPSSRILEEALDILPSTVANMRQLRHQDAESKRAEARLAMAEAEHEYNKKVRKQAEDSKKALIGATSGYDWEGLSDSSKWMTVADENGVIQQSILAGKMPDYHEGLAQYNKAMEIGGMPADELNYSQRKDATDASFMAKKLSIFNALVAKTRREKTAEGWAEKQIMREVERLYGGAQMMDQYESLTSRLGEGVLPTIDYQRLQPSMPWLSSDFSKGKLTSWAFDKDINPETGEVEGWSDLNLKGGAALTAAAWLASKRFPALRGIFGAGAAKGGKKATKKAAQKIFQQQKQLPHTRRYNPLQLPGPRQLPGGRTLQLPGGNKLPVPAGRAPINPVGTPIKPKVSGLGQAGRASAPTIAELLNTAKGLGGGPGGQFIRQPGLGSKIGGWAKGALPYAAPTIGGAIGSQLGGEEGNLLGQVGGTGIMMQKISAPAGKSFLNYLAAKFPSIAARAGAMSGIDGPFPLGDFLALGFTGVQLISLYQQWQNDKGSANSSYDMSQKNKKGSSQNSYQQLIKDNALDF